MLMWLFDSLSAMADSIDANTRQRARHNVRQMNQFDATALVLDAASVPA
jgi:hypothetical protein